MRDHEADLKELPFPEAFPKALATFGKLPGGVKLWARLFVYSTLVKEQAPYFEGDKSYGVPDDSESRTHDELLARDLAQFVAEHWEKRHDIFAALLELGSKMRQAMFITPLIAEVYYRALVMHDAYNGFPNYGELDKLVTRATVGDGELGDFAGCLIQGLDEEAKVSALKQALLTQEWFPDEGAFDALQKEWPEILAKHEAEMAKIEAQADEFLAKAKTQGHVFGGEA